VQHGIIILTLCASIFSFKAAPVYLKLDCVPLENEQ